MSDLLTAAESDALAHYEATIGQGLASFMQVGTALLHLRDERLYRATHATFEDYLRDRWNISRKRGYDLIAGAETVMALSPMGDTPAIESERVARAIGAVVKTDGPERAAEVLREVAEAGPITAKAIAEAHRPAHVTQTTRTTETTKVEHAVDLATGEILNGTVTSEQWEAEQVTPSPEVQQWEADTAATMRAANLRHGFAKWLVQLGDVRLFDPAEMGDIYPDRVDDLARTVVALNEFLAAYRTATDTNRRLHIVKEA